MKITKEEKIKLLAERITKLYSSGGGCSGNDTRIVDENKLAEVLLYLMEQIERFETSIPTPSGAMGGIGFIDKGTIN